MKPLIIGLSFLKTIFLVFCYQKHLIWDTLFLLGHIGIEVNKPWKF